MKAIIDYDSLQLGKSALSDLYSEVHPSVVKQLDPLYESLLQLDDDHDNCFSSEETNLYAISDEITKNNTLINETSSDIETVINQFMDAELGIINKLKIFDKEYQVDDVSKIQSKGLAKAFLSRTDYYSNIHGMYDNKKDGPLSEEEWKKQSAILNKLLADGNSERERAVIYATYIATMYPNKLKYILGGNHCKTKDEYMGLDSTWGYPKDTDGKIDYMDCSAFVLRCLFNGGYNKNDNKFEHPSYAPKGYDVSADVLKNQGLCTEFTNNADVRAGDIVNISGGGGGDDHVGFIIDVDKNNNRMTVAHSSGSGGMNLTTIDMSSGNVIQDSNNTDREGKPYFQTVTRIPYEDESE